MLFIKIRILIFYVQSLFRSQNIFHEIKFQYILWHVKYSQISDLYLRLEHLC